MHVQLLMEIIILKQREGVEERVLKSETNGRSSQRLNFEVMKIWQLVNYCKLRLAVLF